MTRYPNDPGKDQQSQKQYKPTNEYSLLTVEAFAAGMETQTKYAYECAKNMTDEAVKHCELLIDSLKDRLSGYAAQVNSNFNSLKATMDSLNNEMVDLQRRTDVLRTATTARLSNEDIRGILYKIYSLA